MASLSTSIARSLNKRDFKSDFNARTQTCGIGFGQGVRVGEKIYLEGGYMWYKYNDTNRAAPNTYLRALDLSRPFNSLEDLSVVPLEIIKRPSKIPETYGGDLWHYKNHLYLRHGFSEQSDLTWPDWNRWPNETTFEFWRYDIAEDDWQVFQRNPDIINDTSRRVPRLRNTITATVGDETNKKAYVISGEDDEQSGALVKGMMIYDFAEETWSYKPTPWDRWASGLAVHIPLGKGYLLGFSGRDRSDTSLSTIDIFDLSTQKWLSPQPATAAEDRFGIPAPRQQACAVVAQAKDGSSWNIYVYGGRDPSGFHRTYNDVWVLSVPSFKWFLVKQELFVGEFGPQALESQFCGIFGGKGDTEEEANMRGSKMVVFAGRHTPNNIGAVCNPAMVHVFDLNTLEWQKKYDPNPITTTTSSDNDDGDTGYKVPKAISSIIGGNSSGGAILLPDSNSFENSMMELDVKALREKLGLHTELTLSTTPHDSPRKSSNVAVIAGSVIGGLLGLVFIIFLSIYLVKKRRKDRIPSGNLEQKRTELESSPHSGGTGFAWNKPGEVSELSTKATPQELHGYMPPEMPEQWEHAVLPKPYGESGNTSEMIEVMMPPQEAYQSPEYQLPTLSQHQLQQYQYQQPNQSHSQSPSSQQSPYEPSPITPHHYTQYPHQDDFREDRESYYPPLPPLYNQQQQYHQQQDQQ